MKRMKKFAALVLAGAMTLGLAACGGGDTSTPAASSTPDASTPATSTPAASTGSHYASLDPVVLRGADSAGVGAAAQLLGELVAEKVDAITGGQLTVEYYPNSEMGGDMDIQQQMLDGTLDYVVLQTAPTVSFVPAVAVFDLPMVFAQYDGDTIEQVLNGDDSEFLKAIAPKYEEKNMKILGYLQNATYRLTTSNGSWTLWTRSRACRSAPWRTRTTWLSGRLWALPPLPWPGLRCTSPCRTAPSTLRRTPLIPA